MTCLSRGILLTILAGLSGVIISFVPFERVFEGNIDLDLLFKLRGYRQCPSEVVIISVDKFSSEKLMPEESGEWLDNKPEKWPRSLHARLVKGLTSAGARVICFDMVFKQLRSIEDDNQFAGAIRDAGNVVLSASLKDENDFTQGSYSIERLILPDQVFTQAAATTAPFPLPKIPAKVSQYWTFKASAGDIPTLPVAAFQIFALAEYDSFLQLLRKFDQSLADILLSYKTESNSPGNIDKAISLLRETFTTNPQLASEMLDELDKPTPIQDDERKPHILKTLINMYLSTDEQYLNFYGPPRAITTIPYYSALQLLEDTNANHNQIDFNGKAVFVGRSEISLYEQKDGFYTVFSESEGLDISGVEIAATAFANLLEDMTIQSLNFYIYFPIVFFWGMVIGTICYYFSPVVSALSILGLSGLYLYTALMQFKFGGTLYPIFVPLFCQSLVIYLGITIWKYIVESKERKNIKDALKYYLPYDVVDRLSKDIAGFKTEGQSVYGTCLFTDAENFTTLSENIEPNELKDFINKYYKTVFEPINHYGGIVSDIKGDSMLAIWAKPDSDSAIREQACLAALDIKIAVQRFNESANNQKLPIRIGLHSGEIILGNIGALDHYEYRPVGDIVNTASRVEGLNKHLGTRILLSEEVFHQIDSFLTRNLGKFILAGKRKHVAVHELLCRKDESSQLQMDICNYFSDALDLFMKQRWDNARKGFRMILDRYGEDGPSSFYIKLCEQYCKKPIPESWNGIVSIKKK